MSTEAREREIAAIILDEVGQGYYPSFVTGETVERAAKRIAELPALQQEAEPVDAVILTETDHGMGGPFDAKTRDVAIFDNIEMALRAMHDNGYSARAGGGTQFIIWDEHYHRDTIKGRGMGSKSYRLRRLESLPRNVFPGSPESGRSPYGKCPHCGSPGRMRERRPSGNDTCEKGHVYPSSAAIP